MPSNLATLCYKAVERIVDGAQNMCNSHEEQQTGIILQTCLRYKNSSIYTSISMLYIDMVCSAYYSLELYQAINAVDTLHI